MEVWRRRLDDGGRERCLGEPPALGNGGFATDNDAVADDALRHFGVNGTHPVLPPLTTAGDQHPRDLNVPSSGADIAGIRRALSTVPIRAFSSPPRSPSIPNVASGRLGYNPAVGVGHPPIAAVPWAVLSFFQTMVPATHHCCDAPGSGACRHVFSRFAVVNRPIDGTTWVLRRSDISSGSSSPAAPRRHGGRVSRRQPQRPQPALDSGGPAAQKLLGRSDLVARRTPFFVRLVCRVEALRSVNCLQQNTALRQPTRRRLLHHQL